MPTQCDSATGRLAVDRRKRGRSHRFSQLFTTNYCSSHSQCSATEGQKLSLVCCGLKGWWQPGHTVLFRCHFLHSTQFLTDLVKIVLRWKPTAAHRLLCIWFDHPAKCDFLCSLSHLSTSQLQFKHFVQQLENLKRKLVQLSSVCLVVLGVTASCYLAQNYPTILLWTVQPVA